MRTFAAAYAALCLVACGADGTDGTNGLNGQDGKDGKDGQSAADSRIIQSLYCQGALENTALNFTYHAALTAAGDVFVNASIKNVAAEISAATFYSAGQLGAATAQVSFEYDNAAPANGGWWALALDRATGITTISYHDVDVTGGLLGWTMQPSACVKYP